MPTPCLITHYLINDPARADSDRALRAARPDRDDRGSAPGADWQFRGRRDRPARCGARAGPVHRVDCRTRSARTRVAVLLLRRRARSTRSRRRCSRWCAAGSRDCRVDVTVFYPGPEALDARLAARLPFAVRHLPRRRRRASPRRRVPGGFDYVLLFESSGMYRGEEMSPLLAATGLGRLDAVWGSRRLSVRDIEESYRLRYRRNAVFGAISYLGSYLLSLACLVLYGRYITDTLSGVRAVRAADVLEPRRRPDQQEAPTTGCWRRCCGARRRSSRCRCGSCRSRRDASSGPARSTGCTRSASCWTAPRMPARPARPPATIAAEAARTCAPGQMTPRPADPAAGLGSRLVRPCRSCSCRSAGVPMLDRLRRALPGTVARTVVLVAAPVVRGARSVSTSQRAVPVTARCRSGRPACSTRSCSATDAVRGPPRTGLDHLVRSGGGPPGDGARGWRRRPARARAPSGDADGEAPRPLHSPRARSVRPHRARAAPARRRRMPEVGESDMGLFALSHRPTSSSCRVYARRSRPAARHRRAQLPAVHPLAGAAGPRS